jgi:hypothetical protein
MSLKKVLYLTVLFLISLGIISFSLFRYKPFAYYIGNFSVQPGAYSFSINRNDSSEQLVRISPFDDYFYWNNTKDHPISSADFKSSGDITNVFSKFLNGRLINRTRVSWFMESNNGTRIKYDIENISPSEFEITRTFEKTNDKIDAVGQSVIICPDCLVTDNKSRVFFTTELLTAEKLETANQMNLSPLVLSNNILPNDVEKIVILDKNKNPKMTLSTQGHIEVSFDEKWQLLEFKTWLGNQSSVSQTISF